MTEPDYIVLRAYPGAPPGWMPRDLNGRWYDRAQAPQRLASPSPEGWAATAVPVGRFEVRDYDGAIAEVFEVWPAAAISFSK